MNVQEFVTECTVICSLQQ